MSDLSATRDRRYSSLSGVLLVSVPISALFSYWLIGLTGYALIDAAAILVPPVAIGAWVFTTIRATHLAGVRFWSMSSTYVMLAVGIVAALICVATGIFAHEAARNGHNVHGTTFYTVAGLLYAGALGWSFVRNYRTTRSLVLAASLTLLQVISAAVIVGAVYWWIDARNTKRWGRAHSETE